MAASKMERVDASVAGCPRCRGRSRRRRWLTWEGLENDHRQLRLNELNLKSHSLRLQSSDFPCSSFLCLDLGAGAAISA